MQLSTLEREMHFSWFMVDGGVSEINFPFASLPRARISILICELHYIIRARSGSNGANGTKINSPAWVRMHKAERNP
jgi:hypothetical protein